MSLSHHKILVTDEQLCNSKLIQSFLHQMRAAAEYRLSFYDWCWNKRGKETDSVENHITEGAD